MTQNDVLERIGRRLREDSRDVVEEKLPEQWRALVGRLAKLEQGDDRKAKKRANVQH